MVQDPLEDSIDGPSEAYARSCARTAMERTLMVMYLTFCCREQDELSGA